MPLVQVNGVDINYRIDDFTNPWRDRETVKTVLMHHASQQGLEALTQWVPTLARKYRVVRFDTRGCGGSSAPPEPFEMTVRQLVDDTLSLMDQLGLDNVHLVGVHSGGMVTQMIAATHPERVTSLTLCDSPHVFPKALTEGYKALYGPDPGKAISRVGVREFREKTVSLIVDTRRANPKMVPWVAGLMSRVPIHIVISQQKDVMMADTTEILKEIRCPTLHMGGDRASICPPEMLVFMSRQISNSRVVIFPDMGNSPDLIIGEQCAQVMLDFITEVDGD